MASSQASTPSSITTPYLPIKDIKSPEHIHPFASVYYRQHTLVPNRITVEESQLCDEGWSRHAFSMGMPFSDIYRPHAEARKFAQKMQKRPRMSNKQLTDSLLPLIQTAMKPSSKKLHVETEATFHPDAVPKGSPAGRMSNSQTAPSWSMPLPIPKPNITVGFSSKNFTTHELELQDGIISDAQGEPCNLAKISQPIRGSNTMCWPFFNVEIQHDSLMAAQNAAAGSGSTCNNALALLAEAADNPLIQSRGRNLFWQSRRAVYSFSLSIHNDSSSSEEGTGKMATLNLHSSEGGMSHAMAAIRTYDLCNERDVEHLLTRLCSIFVWAENCQLQQIFTLLATLDALVQLESGREYLSDSFPHESMDTYTAPATSPGSGSLSPARRKLGTIKSVLADLSPKWLRAQA
ncbi:uncharacterized protein Z520_05046 [Fonsecaea multimorphosa CBS 102226]|uniref:DUF7924 domain-containing protein n=1 Tax=Fonsecaea multimorphosa CBS 102226 TaxID=1442371 RepID=A0A0D2HC66_9EURO|nr:uncharacterized protein Z520_05046 [Fonsecaea multimorphosa CBS 102226]KIX99470.1 hypothetical protein Z520_05046 [Fonsecaea multimorphosa CBS 102226]OAL25465.1 hypothetical protein AYO22_04784 [Fonsecaea multimorphosa]